MLRITNLIDHPSFVFTTNEAAPFPNVFYQPGHWTSIIVFPPAWTSSIMIQNCFHQLGQAAGSVDAAPLLRRLPPGQDVAAAQPVDHQVGHRDYDYCDDHHYDDDHDCDEDHNDHDS